MDPKVNEALGRLSSTLGVPVSCSLPVREQAILQAALDGKATNDWTTIESTYKDHVGKFHVFSDALKIEGIRVNVSAETEQKIADSMGCLLLTPKLADLAWAQATVKIAPRPRQITSSTQAMVEHSLAIDAQLPPNANGLIQTVGKHWVIDNLLATKPSKAMNYGWHFQGESYQGLKGEVVASLMKDPKTGQYMRLIQGRGTAHDMRHVDYSQTCVLVARECVVDGQTTDLTDVLQNPELAFLANQPGKMTLWRQPGVPEEIVGVTIFGNPPNSNS